MENKNIETLKRILSKDDVAQSVRDNLDELCSIVPEVRNMENFEHKHPHHLDTVLEHTLSALSHSENNFDVRLALLFHDIGKPFCYFEEDGVRHFWGHADASYKITLKDLKNIGFDDDYVNYISALVKLHDTPITKEDIARDRHFYEVLFQIQICDVLAHDPEHNQKRMAYMESIRQLFNN